MLNISMESKRGILFVRLSGQLNKKNISELNKEVIKLLKSVGIKNIVFNLEQLKEIDSYGEKAIIRSFKICSNNQGQMYICINTNKKLFDKKSKILQKINTVKDELTAVKLINS